jgi:predicted nuclease of predicted toxin-antitoxin system
VRWLVDECVDAALAARLREAGHDVVYMSDVAPRAPDAEVIERAHGEDRLLLTEDKDFGDLVFRQAKYTVIEEARYRSRPLRPPLP